MRRTRRRRWAAWVAIGGAACLLVGPLTLVGVVALVAGYGALLVLLP